MRGAGRGRRLARGQKPSIALEGRGLVEDRGWDLDVPAGSSVRREFTVHLSDKAPAGRQVFVLRAAAGVEGDGSDAFLAVDVAP